MSNSASAAKKTDHSHCVFQKKNYVSCVIWNKGKIRNDEAQLSSATLIKNKLNKT